MRDDDFDRDLARRLRAYEGSVPDPDAFALSSPGAGRGLGWLVLGIGGAAVGAAIFLAVLLLQPPAQNIGDTSPTPSASPVRSVAASPSSPASPAASPGLPSPSTPLPAVEPVAPDAWEQVATFTEAGTTHLVEDVAAWAGGFIAVGTRYESDSFAVFGPPPPHRGMVWLSTDGRDWEDATPADVFNDIELQHLIVLDDRLIAVGATVDALVAGADRSSRAFDSSDGRTWQPLELDGISADAFIVEVESGERGILALLRDNPDADPLANSGELWHSTDGGTWTLTRPADGARVIDIGAGDEGFVAALAPSAEGGTAATVIASSDGIDWLDGSVDGQPTAVAPVAGDWFLIVPASGDGEAWADGVPTAVSSSANGLDWSRVGELVTGTFAIEGGISCAEYPSELAAARRTLVMSTILTYQCSEGQVVLAGGAWTSSDGEAWASLPFGPHAFIGGSGERDGVVVVGVDARTGSRADLGVRFWVADN